MAATLVARYTVRDIDAFRPVFDGFEEARRAHGATGHTLLVAGPREVIVLIEFTDAGAADRFAADPARMEALERAGVEARHDVVAEVVERLDYAPAAAAA